LKASPTLAFNLDEFGELEDLEGISLLDDSVALQQSFSDNDFDIFSPLKLGSPAVRNLKVKPMQPLDDLRPAKK
jgi:hypothetical protein